MDALPTTTILGVDIHCVDFAQTLQLIDRWIGSSSFDTCCRQICTVNPEFIVDARRDPAFAQALRRADLRVPDGVGVLWAARWNGIQLAERVTGSDGIYRFCQQAAQRHWRVFLLGAAPGVAQRTATVLQER